MAARCSQHGHGGFGGHGKIRKGVTNIGKEFLVVNKKMYSEE
jgi:hypothetical protein